MKKTTYLVAITLVIAGLLTVVSASAMVQTSQTQKQELKPLINYNPVIEGRDVAMAKAETLAFRPMPLTATPVATGIHPAAASDAFGTVIAGFEADDNVWFTTSVDAGASFNENAVGWTFVNPPSYADADSCGDGRFIGAITPNYLDNEGGELHKVITADPNNIPDGWSASYWSFYDLGSGYYDFKRVACAGYTNDSAEDAWAYGGHTMVGTYNHAAPIVDTPMYSYQFDSTGYAWVYRMDSVKTGCTSTAMDIDQETNHAFCLWNYNNAGNMDLYVYEADYTGWIIIQSPYVGHPDVKEVTITSAGNDTDVDIAALNNDVIIVSQRDGAVVAYYSSNALVTYNEVTIDTEGVNPRVAFSDEGKATCSYVKSGQVYISLTEDGGATWSTPEAIDEPENVDVPSEFKASDTCGLGVAWQQADGNVYFVQAGSPPPVPPILDITGIAGGTKVTATITNTGGSPATNVSWTMTITGGILGRINKTYTGNVASLAPAGSQGITSTGIVLGLGKITITITATCDEGITKTVSSAGKVLIIFIRI